MGHDQKLFYTTHLHFMANICTKYEKDPTYGRKVTVQFIVPFFGKVMSRLQSHEQMTLKMSAKVKSCYTQRDFS